MVIPLAATLPSAIAANGDPCIVALDLRYRDADKLGQWIENSGFDHEKIGDRFMLTNAVDMGNVFLRFSRS